MAFDAGADAAEVFGVGFLGGEARRERVDDEAHLHQLLDGGALEPEQRLERAHDRQAVGRGDDRAATRSAPELHQAFGLEHVERFAQRGPAHAELVEQRLGRGKVRADRHRPGEDPLAQRLGHEPRGFGHHRRAPRARATCGRAGVVLSATNGELRVGHRSGEIEAEEFDGITPHHLVDGRGIEAREHVVSASFFVCGQVLSACG